MTPASAIVWQPLTIELTGPTHSQADSEPNPFLDYRLQVQFTGPSGNSLNVPGYFDGDGNGGPQGNAWRVRFLPTEPGEWTYRVSFRKGPAVAIDLKANAGEAMSPDGQGGTFTVAPRDPAADGVYKWGLLEYVGTHYLKFRDGPYWIKTGLDEPENLLAYEGFIHTRGSHKYTEHAAHWRDGDPDWDGGQGQALIGALNYLADQHVNSIYFLTMNIGGDGKDVWPFAGEINGKGDPANDNLHYDLAKLAQWETVFAHAQRRGLVLHGVLDEAEEANKRELDDAELGPERKLYYRELVARFGHHPALQWNLCEEYNIGGLDLGAERVRAFADYLAALDPYGHPITVHSAGDPVKELAFTFGDPRFSMTSIQLNQRRIDLVTEAVRQATIDAGRPLPVALDEFTVDIGTNKSHIPADRPDDHRRQKLWPTLMSGGTIEFILETLLKVDRFDTPQREKLWEYCWHARKFMEENLPYWEMEPADELVEGAATIDVGIGGGKPSPMGAQVFATMGGRGWTERSEGSPGSVYAVYFPTAAQTGTIRLDTTGAPYTQRWYNPRTGEFAGDESLVEPVHAGTPIGAPPADANQDWVVLFRSTKPIVRSTGVLPRVFPSANWQSLPPAALGLDPGRLNAVAEQLGGRGCIIKHGYVVTAWGGQDVVSDWYSSAKPVLSTLLMFAAKEGKITGFDQPLVEFGWELKDKDRTMTLRHLTNMTSGYARPEAPGTAWSYNDFAIQLYQQTLFDKIFKEDPATAANASERLGALGIEDGFKFRNKNRRISASVRDFARLAWFWLNRGEWDGTQVLPRAYFDDNMRPQVPFDLPQTQMADTDDYLKIGSYGGGSDHFTQHGPGIYGFNWWFNGKGRAHPDTLSWPDAPEELWMSIGFAGNCTAMLPSQDAILVSSYGNWGKFEAGEADSDFNRILKQFAAAVTPIAQ
ncbi:MAG: DUF5060 domain-containing protein [Planctomycetaceae bacterium]|nr:DUF5060 domain-containing protein [Planctomycetaceae bacterium]